MERSSTTVTKKSSVVCDKFRTTLASIPRPKSGDAQTYTDYKGIWKYFKTPFFLKDQFPPRYYSKNFGQTINGPDLSESDESDNDNEEQSEIILKQNTVASTEEDSSQMLYYSFTKT